MAAVAVLIQQMFCASDCGNDFQKPYVGEEVHRSFFSTLLYF